ncbi:cytochrome c3 family protein [Desulfitobacterium sp. Sab5]|uniref:cytochrome c3 family protein n=1 Tax=Desulfitobacterium nosdiversum TaxID=3375356 RepID=UPI003CEE69C5
MNRVKHILILLSFLGLTAIVLVGCNKAPATPQEAVNQAKNAVTAAAYVGNDTCQGCHANKFTNVPHTKHFQSFKPLSDYPMAQALGPITVFDASNTDKPTSATIDLSKDNVYGIMMDNYIVAQTPIGFKDQYYRVAAIEKSGDKWTVKPTSQKDVDKDGKPDWVAESAQTCVNCHASGVPAGSPTKGFSCESCHGPGGIHANAAAADKKTTMPLSTAEDACLHCHKSDPVKDQQGNFTTDNHHGTRDWAFSKHAQTGEINGCLTCHGPHKANANGLLLKKDNPIDICNDCHQGKFDAAKLEQIMWKNPSDAYGHITRDHSFTAIKYTDLGDDPATKPVEIKNQTVIDLIKKTLPDLAK